MALDEVPQGHSPRQPHVASGWGSVWVPHTSAWGTAPCIPGQQPGQGTPVCGAATGLLGGEVAQLLPKLIGSFS